MFTSINNQPKTMDYNNTALPLIGLKFAGKTGCLPGK